MTVFHGNLILCESFIGYLESELQSAHASAAQTQYERPCHAPLVEWKVFETGTEDDSLDVIPSKRNYYRSNRISHVKNFGTRGPFLEQKKGSAYKRHSEPKDLISYTSSDEDFNQQILKTKMKACLASIDSGSNRCEDNAARFLNSLQEDDRSELENIKENNSYETEKSFLEEHQCWQAFIQNTRTRRRCSEFPPPLTSISGRSCSHLPHGQPDCVQLQRIRTKGRFILREAKSLPMVSFRPIRSQGRLVLKLMHRSGMDASHPLSNNPTTENSKAAPAIEMIRAKGKTGNSNCELSKESLQIEENIFANQQTNIPSNLGSSKKLNTNSSLHMDNFSKKDETESIKPGDMHLPELNKTDNIKLHVKSSSSIDDLKRSSINMYFSIGNHRRNSCSMAEELLQNTDFDFSHCAIYSANYRDKLSSDRSRLVDNYLARKAGLRLYENAEKMNKTTQSSLQLSVLQMRKAMRGLDSASSLRCKRSERQEASYMPFRKSNCVASS